jgi:hypothetical protein
MMLVQGVVSGKLDYQFTSISEDQFGAAMWQP